MQISEARPLGPRQLIVDDAGTLHLLKLDSETASAARKNLGLELLTLLK